MVIANYVGNSEVPQKCCLKDLIKEGLASFIKNLANSFLIWQEGLNFGHLST